MALVGIVGLILFTNILDRGVMRSLVYYTSNATLMIVISIKSVRFVGLIPFMNKSEIPVELLPIAEAKMDKLKSSDSRIKDPSFDEILKKTEGFKLFASYLISELNIDSLLFILRLEQIKYSLKKYNNSWIDVYKMNIENNNNDMDSNDDDIFLKINVPNEYLDIEYYNFTNNNDNNGQINKYFNGLKTVYDELINNTQINIPQTLCDDISISIDDNKNILDNDDAVYNKDKILIDLILLCDKAVKQLYIYLTENSWEKFKKTASYSNYKRQFYT